MFGNFLSNLVPVFSINMQLTCCYNVFFQAHSLGPPWGKCGVSKLNYYENYSFMACERECETDIMVERCGCRDAYMPAAHNDTPILCGVDEYLECVIQGNDRKQTV